MEIHWNRRARTLAATVLDVLGLLACGVSAACLAFVGACIVGAL